MHLMALRTHAHNHLGRHCKRDRKGRDRERRPREGCGYRCPATLSCSIPFKFPSTIKISRSITRRTPWWHARNCDPPTCPFSHRTYRPLACTFPNTLQGPTPKLTNRRELLLRTASSRVTPQIAGLARSNECGWECGWRRAIRRWAPDESPWQWQSQNCVAKSLIAPP